MKETSIQWDPQAYKGFQELKALVAQEKKINRNPTYEQLLSSINKEIENLKTNPYHGDLIPRKYLNKKAVDKYGTDKLFRIELVGYWRMIYTVIGEQTKIVALILEYMDHPTYDKLFGYKKK